MLIVIGSVLPTGVGVFTSPSRAVRRHPRSLRHAGHHLHRVLGPIAAGDRGSGHLPADDRHAVRAALEGGARLLVHRRLVRLRGLRGGDRHLLGSVASSNTSRLRAATCRAVCLPVRGDGQEALACRATRTTQDWQVHFAVAKAECVAEVASVGGLVDSTASSSSRCG